MDRLTKRAANGLPYLAKVKDGETAVEGSYNTLKCIQEAFERLASLEEMVEQGKLVEVVRCVECKLINSCDAYQNCEFCSLGIRT